MPARDWTVDQQDQLIAEAVERDRPRLRSFIRKHVLDMSDAEDVLQDVFYELTATYRMMKPVEQVTAWLYRVARNRIADLFRRQKDAGPDALYARNLMLEALDEALDELPENQREVFVAHEWMGKSFKQLAEETGESGNTLLSRKHYAVLHLRRRLQAIYDEYMNP